MSQQSQTTPDQTTPRPAFGVSGLSSVAASIIKAILSPRETVLRHMESKDRYIVQLRKDVRNGKNRPVHQWLRLSASDLDDNIPLSMVLQPYHEAITFLTGYAERKARREGTGLLPFNQRLARVEVREQEAQGKGDIAQILVRANPDDVDSLRAARLAVLSYDGPQAEYVRVLTDRILELESR